IGRGFGHLHEICDQAGIIGRLVDHCAMIGGPGEAPPLIAAAMRAMLTGRPGPAALECPIAVWGPDGSVRALATPAPVPTPPIDEDAILAAARRLGAARRPLIVCGGGAQDAAQEIALIAHMLQAPVLGYRRGRGVLGSRDPLSITLPLGHELWREADAVLAVGTRLLNPQTAWGLDDELTIIRIDADPDEPARFRAPPARVTRSA